MKIHREPVSADENFVIEDRCAPLRFADENFVILAACVPVSMHGSDARNAREAG